jgi:hypothetical protein
MPNEFQPKSDAVNATSAMRTSRTILPLLLVALVTSLVLVTPASATVLSVLPQKYDAPFHPTPPDTTPDQGLRNQISPSPNAGHTHISRWAQAWYVTPASSRL